MIKIGIVTVLAGLSITDVRKRSIPAAALAVFVAVTVIYAVCIGRNMERWDILGIVLLAGGIYGVGKLTDGQIGSGDAAIIFSLGMVLGFRRVVAVVWLGFVLCGIFGLVLMLLGRATRKTKLPFVPFLTVAQLVLMVTGGLV